MNDTVLMRIVSTKNKSQFLPSRHSPTLDNLVKLPLSPGVASALSSLQQIHVPRWVDMLDGLVNYAN